MVTGKPRLHCLREHLFNVLGVINSVLSVPSFLKSLAPNKVYQVHLEENIKIWYKN